MPVCSSCNWRILIRRDSLSPSKLVSLDELRADLREETLRTVCQELERLAAQKCPAALADLPQDVFAKCIVLLVTLRKLRLFVKDDGNGAAYEIDPRIALIDCYCWSLHEAAIERRFITKPSRIAHGSPEIGLDGQRLFVLMSQARSAFRLGAISDQRLKEILRELYRADPTLTMRQVFELVRQYPEARRVSDPRIRLVAAGVKPEARTRPGRPHGSSS